MNSHHVNTAHDVTDCCVLTRLSTTRTTVHECEDASIAPYYTMPQR